MTKKKGEEHHKVIVSIRCSIFEKKRIDDIRNKLQMSISDYVNRLIIEGNNKYEKRA